MKKFYYLESCNTCKRIMNEINFQKDTDLREIKSMPLTETEVDRLAAKSGSYASIFSKRARKYRELGLHEKELTEKDYRHYLLEDYTFLKRPLLETNHQIVAGNSKKDMLEMRDLSQL